jgi:hypothetical protein
MPLVYLADPQVEWDLSVKWYDGCDNSDGEGWPEGWWWRLSYRSLTGGYDVVLCDYPDLGGGPLLNVDPWLLQLTGYTREEFISKFLSDVDHCE